jgi:hypothetical protein
VRLAGGQTFGPAFEDMIVQWARERRIPADAEIVPVDDAGEIAGDPTPAGRFGTIREIVAAPPTAPTGAAAAPPTDDFFSTMVPTRNAYALVGYYLAVAGLIPCLGLPFSIAAIVCGIVGYKKWREDSSARGKTHAIIAILGGLLVPIAYSVLWYVALMAGL